MKRKYETRCWLCGSTDLEPDDRGIVCKSCGATYNIIPKPGASPITFETTTDYKEGKPIKFLRARPSDIEQRRAAKARSDS